MIEGLIHNDDPAAAEMWMPKGSFWTQPAGESHITSAKGDVNIALVEIDAGPYLVKPVEQSFDKGEKPVNIVANNIVWVPPPGFELADNAPQIAYLWGALAPRQQNGTFLRIPQGVTVNVSVPLLPFKAVVISGQIDHNEYHHGILNPGSYIGSVTYAEHIIQAHQETILYINTYGQYQVDLVEND